jgi:hypothetical protein
MGRRESLGFCFPDEARNLHGFGGGCRLGFDGERLDSGSCLDNRCGLEEWFIYQRTTGHIEQHFASATNLLWVGRAVDGYRKS